MVVIFWVSEEVASRTTCGPPTKTWVVRWVFVFLCFKLSIYVFVMGYGGRFIFYLVHYFW